ncbi:MAG TPA: hypothetical protein VFY42_10050, partial [Gemmatimonadales bacterium]|nr:hypothetical protein [Gemmatimonadales bacterium]
MIDFRSGREPKSASFDYISIRIAALGVGAVELQLLPPLIELALGQLLRGIGHERAHRLEQLSCFRRGGA